MGDGRQHRRHRRGLFEEKRRTTQRKDEDVTSYIPFDIIKDILTRLPQGSLHRIKSVWKRWETFIDSEDFIESQLHKSSQRPIFFSMGPLQRHEPFPETEWGEIYPFDDRHKEYSDSCRKTKHAISRILSSVPVDGFYIDNAFHLESSLDGLLCFSRHLDDFWSDYVVINPVTRYTKLLPPCRVEQDICEIVQDPVSKEYKVLLASIGDYEIPIPVFGSMVFTLNSDDSWRELYDEDYYFPRIPFPRYSPSNFARPRANGAVHWMHDDFPFDIIAFDIRSETFSIIKIPERTPEQFRRMCLAEYSGNLCLICFNDSLQCMDFMVLADYEKQTWTVNYRVDCKVFHRKSAIGFKNIAYLGTNGVGEILMLLTFNVKTIRKKRKFELVTLSYNPGLRKLLVLKTDESYSNNYYAIVKYVESLVCPENIKGMLESEEQTSTPATSQGRFFSSLTFINAEDDVIGSPNVDGQAQELDEVSHMLLQETNE